jgi:hypothetical protein
LSGTGNHVLNKVSVSRTVNVRIVSRFGFIFLVRDIDGYPSCLFFRCRVNFIVSSRLGEALGGRSETFMGLTGMGDLILTCTGDLSRNRRVGLELAGGQSLQQVLQSLGHVAEGVLTAAAVQRRARDLGIEMPITNAVCAVLFEGLPPARAVQLLLARDPRAEG